MIIISGPSTIGKNPLIERICNDSGFNFVVPWTTRSKRAEEVEGKDYYFITKDIFRAKILNKSIAEWDYCLSNYYGYGDFDISAKKMITHGLSRLATRIKQNNSKYVTTVFLMPENKDSIMDTLKKIYTGKDYLLRSELVDEELGHSVLFDYKFSIRNNVLEVLQDKNFIDILNRNR